MTQEIIKLSATLLGLDDIIAYLNDTTIPLDDDSKRKMDDLLLYLNYILREITKEYYPLSHEEIVSSDNQCQIFFKNFSKTPIAIKDVKDDSNNSVTFNLYPEFIKIGKPLSRYLVKYNYLLPKITSINDKLILPIGLEPFIICYGIASEYTLSKLLYNESEMWESKFKTSLENIKSRIGERRFFARSLK